MEFVLKGGSLEKQRTGCIVVGVYEGGQLSPSAMELDTASGHAVNEALNRGDLEGELSTTLLLTRIPKAASERVLLVGLGPEREFVESSYHTALCAATRTLRTTGAAEATLCLNELPVNGRGGAWKIEQEVLAVMDGMYRFDKLKSEPPKRKRALKKVVFHVADRSEASAAEAAFLAVAGGSRQPPKLIVMEYHGGAREALPVVLVGKGITFDTGGVNIKSSSDMEQMKFDMCGAASVFGALRAAALMKLPLNVVGIIPAAENMPDGNAIKPGDVVTTMSGQTVEILDTDSEGRLVLSDALTYAEKYKPAVLVDVATLTGAIVSALGEIATGVFSNSDALVREVLEAGDSAWDRAWHMPLWHEYQDTFKSNIADFANVGPRGDCAITAACFLSRFTKRYPWVHLDIAGTASKSGEDKGATGRPVALLVHFLAGRAAA